jgi:hypothetical protein
MFGRQPSDFSAEQGYGWSVAAGFEIELFYISPNELPGDLVNDMAVFKNTFDVYNPFTHVLRTNANALLLILEGTVHQCAGEGCTIPEQGSPACQIGTIMATHRCRV